MLIKYIYLIITDDIMIDLRQAIFTLSEEKQQEFISFLDSVIDLIPVIKLFLLIIFCYQFPEIIIFFIFISTSFHIFNNFSCIII